MNNKDNKSIVYFPYFTVGIASRIIIVFMVILTFLFFLLQGTANAFFEISVIEIFVFALCHYGLILSKKMLVFDESGLYVVNENSVKFKFIPWSSLSYVYCRHDYKGFRYLILSSNKLCEGQVKKIFRKSVVLSKICVKEAIVIFLDKANEKQTSQIERVVEQNIQINDKQV